MPAKKAAVQGPGMFDEDAPAAKSTKTKVTVDSAAERALVGAILASPAIFDDVHARLSPESFGDHVARLVYTAIVACDQGGVPVDVVTVADELRRSNNLLRVGDVEGVQGLLAQAGGVESVAAYTEIVADLSDRRRVRHVLRDALETVTAPETTGAEAIETVERMVFELTRSDSGSTMVSMAQAMAELQQELARVRNGRLIGESSGFDRLDDLTAGFQPGQLIVVAARPGMGKSAFALQLARHIAEVSGKTVPFLSYEMSVQELALRLLSQAMAVSAGQLRSGVLPSEVRQSAAQTVQRLSGLPVLLDDQPAETIERVWSDMRRKARRVELGAIVVDYIQLMETQRRSRDPNRTEEVSLISRKLKKMATELQVPVIALSQLNRGLESRPNKRPMLSDLRESGAIEQDANLVLFLYRDHVYDPAADPSRAEIIVAKNRAGETGTVSVDWQGEYTRFVPAARNVGEFE